MEIVDEKLELVFSFLSSRFYESVNSFRYVFYKFKAILSIKVVPSFPHNY